MTHLIRFFDDPVAQRPKEVGFLFASAFDEAVETAKASLPQFKATRAASGYRVEDVTGRTVWIGPGKYEEPR
jgi:hypothetical protein